MNLLMTCGVSVGRVPGADGEKRRQINILHLFIFLVAGCCLLPATFPTSASAFKEFRIGTGGRTGVYYPIGKLIATGLTKAAQEENSPLHGYIGVAQNSAGSIENARNIANRTLDAGLVQADIAATAFQGTGLFQGHPLSSLRAVASLYSEKFQIVVRSDSRSKALR